MARQTRRQGARGSIVVVAIAVALVAAACGGGSDSDSSSSASTAPSDANTGRDVVDEGEAQYGGTLVVGVSGESDGWTPQTNTFADAGTFVGASVIEALAIFDKDGNAVPYLAEKWEANDALDEWTITLRDGIEFHDGTPLDAEAAKANIDTAVNSPLIGVAMQPMIDEVEVVDDLTFIIHTKRPWSALPGSMLALQPGMMVSPAMFEMDAYGARTPIGTGPFVFEEWVQDDHFTAVRNENYWRKAENGDQLPYLDKIEFRVIVDSSARAAALDSGDIDMMYTVRAADIANYRTSDAVQLIEDNRSEETFVQLNEAVPPFDNIHARRAVAYAVDQSVLDAVFGEGIVQGVVQPFNESEPFYNPEPGYVTYDPDKAAEELALYLEDTGESELSFAVKGLPSVDDARLLQLLVQQWDEVGIKAEVANVEQTTFITDLAFGNFQAAYFRNFAGTEPDSFYVYLHSSHSGYPDNISINFTNTKNDRIDELLDEERMTADPAARAEIFKELVPVINEELPYVWLFNTPYALVSRPEVHGLNPARELGFGDFEFKWWLGQVWLEQ